MQRYFVHLCYDGTGFHGWQRQPDAISVQEYLEKAFSLMLRTEIGLTGCGRTDTGVHAGQYFAHFDLERDLDQKECITLTFRMNSYLDQAVAIRDIFPVEPVIHARFSALSRTYRYCIARRKDPFRNRFAHYIYGDLDTGRMNRCAGILPEFTDFTSFSKVDTDTATNLCRIDSAIFLESEYSLEFLITADRFLRNMVRAIMGTLLDVGRGRLTEEGFREVIRCRDRNRAGMSVPACGLFLDHVSYPPGVVPAAVGGE